MLMNSNLIKKWDYKVTEAKDLEFYLKCISSNKNLDKFTIIY